MTGRMFALTPRSNGYVSVCLVGDGGKARHYVHRLVADAFLLGCPSDREVNHLNFVRHDNVVTNLEVVTRLQNAAHSRRANRYPKGGIHIPRGDASALSKITDAQVQAVRRRVAAGERQAHVARDVGVCKQQVWNIVHGRSRLPCPR